MEKKTYKEALDYANKERKKQGFPPLDFLPRGKPGSGSDCPLARAGVSPRGDFVGAFDKEASGLEEIDPWVLVENGDPLGNADEPAPDAKDDRKGE